MMRRAARLEEDQVDRVVNSRPEKRLARALLILASLDAESDEPRVLEHMTNTPDWRRCRRRTLLGIGELKKKFAKVPGPSWAGRPTRAELARHGVLPAAF